MSDVHEEMLKLANGDYVALRYRVEIKDDSTAVVTTIVSSRVIPKGNIELYSPTEIGYTLSQLCEALNILLRRGARDDADVVHVDEDHYVGFRTIVYDATTNEVRLG